MNHAEVHSYMADYLEGDLDLTKRALLDAHLDGCEACSLEFAEMRGTIGLLRGLPAPEPPPFLVDHVMRRIREGEGQYRFVDRLREWARNLATPQIALPATALGLGLLMATGNLDPDILSFGDREPAETVRVAATNERLAASDAARGIPPSFQIPVSGRPPAVAQVPRVTITLPLPGPSLVAGNDAGPQPFYTRRPSRSIRNSVPTLPASGAGLSTPVANRVDRGRIAPEAAAQASAFTADGDTLAMSPEERRTRELDERLDEMIRDPKAFSADFASYSVVEQDIWLEALAERARETGRGAKALDELRLTGDRSAMQLATALSVELQRQEQGQEGLPQR